jgi:hypothetical protein
VGVVLCGELCVGGQAPKSGTSTDREIAAAVRELGNDSLEVRTAARKKLLAIGLTARRQLKEATRSKDPQIARAAGDILEESRKERLAKAKVHVVGVYQARGKEALVEVDDPENPVILVLCAYESVKWAVKPTVNTDVVQIIVSGYHKQEVSAEGLAVTVLTHEDESVGPDGQPFYFYAYDHDEDRYPAMAEKIRLLTGKRISSFQGRSSYRKVPFRVGKAEM